MMQTISQELTAFWTKLCFFAGKLTGGWGGFLADPSGVAKGDLAMMALTLLAVAAFLIGGVFAFIKAPWKKKGGMLLTALLVLLLVAVLLFFALREVELPSDGGVEEVAVKTVEVDGEERELSCRYGLAVGAEDAWYDMVHQEWVLTDDSVALPLEDGGVFVLSGIHSLPGRSDFMTQQLRNYGAMCFAELKRLDRSGSKSWDACDDFLEVRVHTNTQLADQPFCGEPGQEKTYDIYRYEILEKSEDSAVSIEWNSGWLGSDGRMLAGLSAARQVGPDVIQATVRAWAVTYSMNGDTLSTAFHDPRENEQQMARMREVVDAVLDGRAYVLRGLTDEELAAVLPDRVKDVPTRYAGGNGGFSIPCTRLLGMETFWEGKETFALMEWLGTDAEGRPVRYSLRNEGIGIAQGAIESYNRAKAAYEAGMKTPDEAMSAFIGCRAVPYEGGWLLNPGGFSPNGPSNTMQNYYYLTATVE